MASLSVLGERRPRERRVALVPDELARLDGSISVTIESGAGVSAGALDADYAAAGATITPNRDAALDGADLVVKVQPPTEEEAGQLREGAVLVSFLPPTAYLDVVRVLAERKVTAIAFDLVPRISRAQGMDALSSQASIAGYRAVLAGASRLGRLFPMMMTAAGTLPPARVLVIGAGVAGLQAVATARRLGAAVSAYDVRPEAGEEVRSLGATFVELSLEARQGSGGYAAEQGSDFLARQEQLLATTAARSDVIITTAAVPGRPAPKLLSAATVGSMRRGSVVVDLAAASGGNCELTRDGEEVDHEGVLVLGAGDLASDAAAHASAVYGRNVTNLMKLLVVDGELRTELDDEVLAASVVTSMGQIRHQPTRELIEELEGGASA